MSEFIDVVENKGSPPTKLKLWAFEFGLSGRLPIDYRAFLRACNGGYVGGALWFKGPTADGKSADAGIHHIGGFRQEDYFSITAAQRIYKGRIPRGTIWIMDDPFGNAICLGVSGELRGKVFFWDHELEPDDEWDGQLATAENVQLLANSFTDFIAGLTPNDDKN